MTTTEVRGGETVHMTRWVLGIGLVLVILAFVGAWFVGAY